jgi:hypothetical protein
MGWFSWKRIRTLGTKYEEAALAQFNHTWRFSRVANKKNITSISQGFPLYNSTPYEARTLKFGKIP